jgi:hypothetical protein
MLGDEQYPRNRRYVGRILKGSSLESRVGSKTMLEPRRGRGVAGLPARSTTPATTASAFLAALADHREAVREEGEEARY